MKKNFVVRMNGCSYIVDTKSSDIALRYTYGDGWVKSIQGKKAASLTDRANDVYIRMKNVDIIFDYSELNQLYMLLALYYEKINENK